MLKSKGNDSLREIMKAFYGEFIIPRYIVLDYQVDLYFPKYKICVEYYKKDRAYPEDHKRDYEITKKLNCRWYRYHVDSEDYDIIKVINGIFQEIMSSINKNKN